MMRFVPGFYLIFCCCPSCSGLAGLAAVLAFSLHLAKQQLGFLYPLRPPALQYLSVTQLLELCLPNNTFCPLPKTPGQEKG